MFRHLIVVFLTLVGCASLFRNPNGVYISDVNFPLMDIRAVVLNILPIGPRGGSPNGRELFSKHFVLGPNNYLPANDANRRYYAHILILGDRRPYNVQIFVAREKRVYRNGRFTYVVEGYDRDLARELEYKFQHELAKRREERNIIDDFRVF